MSEILYLREIETDIPGEQNLDALNISVCDGEVLGITGLTGSGVYVLADLLEGIIRPSSGEVYWKGEAVKHGELSALLKKNVYVIGGDNMLIERMTSAENIEVIRHRGMHEFFVHPRRTEGYAKLLYDSYQIRFKPGEKVYRLSNLERLYLAVLKGIREKAEILVLCDVCESLSDAETSRFRKFLSTICDRGTAVILISTDFSKVLELSDRVMVLRSGMCCLREEACRLGIADVRTRAFPEPHMHHVIERETQTVRKKVIFQEIDFFEKMHRFDLTLESGAAVGLYGENIENNEVLYRAFTGKTRTRTIVSENNRKISFERWRRKHHREIVSLRKYFWRDAIFSRLSGRENIQLRSMYRFRYHGGVLNKNMQDLAFRDFCKKYGLDENHYTIPAFHMDHITRYRLIFYQLLYEPPEILILDSPLYAMDEEMKRILLDCIQILKGNGTAILMCDANEQMLRVYCDQVIQI